MEKLKWDEKFSVGVREIDEQHKMLFAMINELNTALVELRGREVQREIIQGMVRYARYHFATEEQYMDKFGYADTAAHKKEHMEFVKKAHDLQERADSGLLILTIEIIGFLNDWIMTHIKTVDKKYSALFKEKGLS